MDLRQISMKIRKSDKSLKYAVNNKKYFIKFFLLKKIG